MRSSNSAWRLAVGEVPGGTLTVKKRWCSSSRRMMMVSVSRVNEKEAFRCLYNRGGRLSRSVLGGYQDVT